MSNTVTVEIDSELWLALQSAIEEHYDAHRKEQDASDRQIEVLAKFQENLDKLMTEKRAKAFAELRALEELLGEE